MLSLTHSSVAISILYLPLPMEVTVPLAIMSHVLLDTIGEQTYDQWRFWQVVGHVTLLVIGYLSVMLPIVVGGIILGNLIDIFDKLISKGLFKKELIHSNKLYPPVLIGLTGLQTSRFDLFLAIGASLLLLP